MATSPTIDATTRRSAELFLGQVADKFPIMEARLFGSRARGDANDDSDVDIAVILDGPKRRSIDVASDMADAGFDVLMKTGLVISVLPIGVADWLNPSLHTNPFLIANVKREGLIL